MSASLFLIPMVLAWGASDINVTGNSWTATIRHGSIVSMQGVDGATLVRAPVEPRGVGVHREAADHWADVAADSTSGPPRHLAAGVTLAEQFHTFSDAAGARVAARYTLDQLDGDLVIEQDVEGAAAGVWGTSWWIADIPLECAIIVPGSSGVRLTADTPGSRHEYDYPILWEAQLVIVEGGAGGFSVWCEDQVTRFKRLVVERHAGGWRLGFYTLNDAPFAEQTSCQGVAWRLTAYEGDWRVPARRYRDWWQRHAEPIPVARQEPAWVGDLRGCVIMPMQLSFLERLPDYFDPAQTLLYVYDWREPGYDRQYPDYESLRPQLMPFIERARALGFRVMLHVNYFGVDPLHPVYAQFEPYQVRDPFGTHEKQWWTWPPEDPDIRFAYINPASRAWRDYFTQAMVRLCERTGVDALHLDQTLCIYNDYNGRIDGMNMMEGNIALHRQLRAALPHVALSGEGLNEITCRHEALAQRHAWGVNHAKSVYDRRLLAAAHPISSYILRPFTVIYGYLGYVSPENPLYPAWNEAYRQWGVIPTLKPDLGVFEQPGGFSRQFFDELRFWQEQRVELNLDGPWPREIVMPLRTADGRDFVATRDRQWLCDGHVISQTITGVTTLAAPGNIPGWRAFDDGKLLGLDPEQWYPYFPEPRDSSVLHIDRMPGSVSLAHMAVGEQVALIRMRDATPGLADITLLLERAATGTRLDDGTVTQETGTGVYAGGGAVSVSGDTITQHPPWKGGARGETYAKLRWRVPSEYPVWLVSEVQLDPGAVGEGKSDGVTFSVRATDGTRTLSESVHQAASQPQPLELNLTPLAGQEVDLELIVDPGPQRNPSYDWARWRRPRLERRLEGTGTIEIAGDGSWKWCLTAAGAQAIDPNAPARAFEVPLTGAFCLLRHDPPPVTLPYSLSGSPDEVFYCLDSGQVVEQAQFAAIRPGVNSVGGRRRDGFLAHPPNRGRTVALYYLRLPQTPVRFSAHVGLRDGSKSEGVRFAVEVNGCEQRGLHVRPGPWESLEADLAAWAGQPIVLSLVTDSAGGFEYDWAVWGEPVLRAR